MVVTGDPTQSDLARGQSGLAETVQRLSSLKTIGRHYFSDQDVVRHPLVGEMLPLLDLEPSEPEVSLPQSLVATRPISRRGAPPNGHAF